MHPWLDPIPNARGHKAASVFVACELLHCIARRVPLSFSDRSTKTREYPGAAIKHPLPGEQAERLATSEAFCFGQRLHFSWRGR